MGTAAFDAAWGGDPTKPKKSTALDALWDTPSLAPAPSNDIHAQYRSGLLAKRMQRENQNDQEAAAVDEPSSALGAFGHSLAATGANIAQGIPGMEAAEAGARSLFRRQPYREALSDIRGATGQIPGALRTVERIAGAAPLAAVLPGSAALSGAAVGAAEPLLDADPDRGRTSRVLGAGLGAAGGALGGKIIGSAITGARSILPQRLGGTSAALPLMKMAQRVASAKQLYGAALSEGRAHEATDAVRSFLADPDIQEVVSGLQQTDQFARLSPESPEMLDAVYKTLSDQAKQARKGLAAANPTKANQGRFNLQNIVGKQRKLMEALGAPGQSVVTETTTVPAMQTAQSPPPDLRSAISDFWSRPGIAARRAEGTVEQRMARSALERHGTEASIPPIRGGSGPQEFSTERTQYAPAMMPTYPHAVQDYAKRSAEIEAIKRGYEAAQSGFSGNAPSFNNLIRKSPISYADWARSASPEDLTAARQGVMVATKVGTHFSANPLKGFGIPDAIAKANVAARLLQQGHTTPQAYLETLQNLGLLTAGNATSP